MGFDLFSALAKGTTNLKPKAKPTASMYQMPAGVNPTFQAHESTAIPINAAAIKLNQANPGLPGGVTAAREYLRAGGGGGTTPNYSAPRLPGGGSSGGGGSGGGRFGRGGRGGGGGGGGGGSAAATAQSQLDLMLQLLGSKSYTATPETGVRGAITGATTADLASANSAYGNLDAWLRQNQTNPYANMQLARAPTAPSYNPYLESQGVAPLNNVQQNPDDAYGGFQNVLKLLGANQVAGNQSQLAESLMGRTSATTNINAMDNAQLAAVAQKEYANQQALDAEKRAAILQMAPLLGAGAKAPTDWLEKLGLV